MQVDTAHDHQRRWWSQSRGLCGQVMTILNERRAINFADRLEPAVGQSATKRVSVTRKHDVPSLTVSFNGQPLRYNREVWRQIGRQISFHKLTGSGPFAFDIEMHPALREGCSHTFKATYVAKPIIFEDCRRQSLTTSLLLTSYPAKGTLYTSARLFSVGMRCCAITSTRRI